MNIEFGVRSDPFTNQRAYAKLLKEATRVKQVLSANTETTARIENLLDGVDLSVRVTRAQFEELCAPLMSRALQPALDALRDAGVTKEQIDGVLLFGGATRSPFVHAVLKEGLGKTYANNTIPIFKFKTEKKRSQQKSNIQI